MKSRSNQLPHVNFQTFKTIIWKYLLVLIVLSSCGSTEIKYIQHGAAHNLRISNTEVITAPPNHHYMVYLVNCIDNTKGKDAIFFKSSKLRDASGQDTREIQVQGISKLVAKGGIETNIGAVVFIIPGEIDHVFSNLTYASGSGESVLMVNQTTTGSSGVNFFGYTNDTIDLTESISSPFLNEPCDDKGKSPH